MAEPEIDVVAIGNAIVDVLSQADDGFLETHGLAKGVMTLIDASGAEGLYAAMGPGVEMSGGSAANTVAGLASFGGSAGFIGKVRDDQLGAVFSHDIRSLGVSFTTAPATEGAATARCLILVTPDAQRTLNTYLGACTVLGPDDIDPETISAAKVIYLEGYLWDPPGAKQAFRKAMDIARKAGRKVALSLSDPFCVDRYREEFHALVTDGVDLLFANEAELISLYEAESFDEALQQIRGHCEVAALTRGDKGSVVVSGDEVHVIDAEPVARLVDTTGAGDLYAAGFLFGYTQGEDLARCGR
ncbi:MAG: adenosine kinase, partial [Alphaproteobacteria bacterium]|nr:adenosine kinase [Alphaproteobacteria bacterium]